MIKKIQVYDITEKIAHEIPDLENQEVNLSDFLSGIYLIKIKIKEQLNKFQLITILRKLPIQPKKTDVAIGLLG